jgi:hypothetical protein
MCKIEEVKALIERGFEMSSMRTLARRGTMQAGRYIEPIPDVLQPGHDLTLLQARVINPSGGRDSVEWDGRLWSPSSLLNEWERQGIVRAHWGVFWNLRIAGRERSIRAEAGPR